MKALLTITPSHRRVAILCLLTFLAMC